jgi:hypothetical protein
MTTDHASAPVLAASPYQPRHRLWSAPLPERCQQITSLKNAALPQPLRKNVNFRGFATGNEVDEDHDDRNDQQDVNQPADGGTGHQSQQPQNNQHYRNGV